MKPVSITETPYEVLDIKADEDRIALVHNDKARETVRVIILNKREAVALHGVLGEWIREGK